MAKFLLSALCILAAIPAIAATPDELKAQLEAQKQINELLKQRIETLEAELAGRKPAAPPRADNAMEVADEPEADRALERALERRGSAVLPAGTVEITPGLLWSHSGRDANRSTDDQYGARLDARIGLPSGWMVGIGGLYLKRDINGVGDNSGVGDVNATVWKSLFSQKGARPSLVASLGYIAPTGDNFANSSVPLGDGFHKLTARLSSVKTLDPIALFGDLFYTHHLEEKIPGFEVDRSDALGFGLGASLAVTPDVSLTTGLNYSFEDEVTINGVKVAGSETTQGQFQLGLGVLLSKNVFLNLFGSFGITDDSPDGVLGVSLPIRF